MTKSELWFICMLIIVSPTLVEWERNLGTLIFSLLGIFALTVECWNAYYDEDRK